MAQCDCPNCGSSDTRSISLLYQAGTAYSTIWTREGIGSASSQTALASRLSPPSPPGLGCWGVPLRLIAYVYAFYRSAQIGFEFSSKYGMQAGHYDGGPAFGLFLLCLFGSIIALELAIFLILRPFQGDYRRALQNWLHQFLCMRCGCRFIPQ